MPSAMQWESFNSSYPVLGQEQTRWLSPVMITGNHHLLRHFLLSMSFAGDEKLSKWQKEELNKFQLFEIDHVKKMASNLKWTTYCEEIVINFYRGNTHLYYIALTQQKLCIHMYCTYIYTYVWGGNINESHKCLLQTIQTSGIQRTPITLIEQWGMATQIKYVNFSSKMGWFPPWQVGVFLIPLWHVNITTVIWYGVIQWVMGLLKTLFPTLLQRCIIAITLRVNWKELYAPT